MGHCFKYDKNLITNMYFGVNPLPLLEKVFFFVCFLGFPLAEATAIIIVHPYQEVKS